MSARVDYSEFPVATLTPDWDLAGLVDKTGKPLRRDETVSGLEATPIDSREVEFVEETLRLTGDGVDAVFDGIGGSYIWRSVKALRVKGKVVVNGITSTLEDGRLAGGRRHRLRGLAIFGIYIIATAFLPGRKRMTPYSIQTLKRSRLEQFSEELPFLLELLRLEKIKPIHRRKNPVAGSSPRPRATGRIRLR